MEEKKNNDFSRRSFIKSAAIASAGFTILPSYVVSGLGHKAPSDLLNIACVGAGGVGRRKLRNMGDGMQVVALCDVDWRYSKDAFGDYPNAKRYWDWRKMYDEMGNDIDAVVVATPDHTHAIVAAHAMTLGKHVYVEKPLTWSVAESRLLTQLADKYGVATQMGNQGNSSDDIRKVCEWVWNDEIGEVREVHTWTNRPIWPQGLERPAQGMWVPDHLNWDLFLGPAPMRPYHEIYTPWNWRGWWDFGTGALGDMACHIMDPVFKALKLQYPTRVQGSSTMMNTESPPQAETVHFVFPERPRERGIRVRFPEVKISWYDGGLLPARPHGMADDFAMGDWNGGTMFVGTKDILVTDCYSERPRLVSGRVPNVPQRLPRIAEGLNHESDWVRACKEPKESRVEASSNFSYSGPFNETVVMGVLAVRLQDLKRELLWDGENMKFTNISPSDEIRVVTSDRFEVIDGHPHFDTQFATMNALEAAKEYINRTYREGWSLPKV